MLLRFSGIVGILYCFAICVSGCTPSTPAETFPAEYQGNTSTVYGTGLKINLKDPAAAASDFKWKDSTGVIHSLQEYQGRVVVLNFWAIWCGYCVNEMPDLQAVSQDLKADSVVVIGVSIDQTGNTFHDVSGFAKTLGVTYQIISDPQQTIYKNWSQENALPQTFIIDATGAIRVYFNQGSNKKAFENAVKQVL